MRKTTFIIVLLLATLLTACGVASKPGSVEDPHLKNAVRTPISLLESGGFSVGDTLDSSAGIWNNSPTSYTYQWEDCNTSGTGCMNISGATSSSYTVASSDVGHTIRVVVTAHNSVGSASATSAATPTVGTCNNSTDIPVGYPNNCSTGYQNAPGYTGTLSTSCPTTFASNTTYSFCEFTSPVFVGGSSSHPTNVTFIGCLFEANESNPSNDTAVGDYAGSVTFSYDTFAPVGTPTPPVSNLQGYDHSIDQRYAGGIEVDHSNLYGWAEAIEFNTSSQSEPVSVSTSWFHDPRNPSESGGGTDHTDALLDNSPTSGTDPYMTFNNNSILASANTNALGLQNTGGYANLTVTNNYFSGFGYTVNISQASTADTNTVFTGNVFGSSFEDIFGPLYGASFPNGTGDTWSNNKYYVASDTSWLDIAANGTYWWPTDCFGSSNCSSPATFTGHATDYVP